MALTFSLKYVFGGEFKNQILILLSPS